MSPDIQREYEKSLAALLPIKAELSRTDALIDRVVYQLYGLTDDEIRLIEYPGLAEAAGSARQETLKETDIAPDSDAAVDRIVEKIAASRRTILRAGRRIRDCRSRLRAALANWDALPANVQKFLRTGETLIVRNNIEDYSGVMIYYAKRQWRSLLMARWFEPFRATRMPTPDVVKRYRRSSRTCAAKSR